MNTVLGPYLVPGICGALVSVLVRLIFGDAAVAAIGFVVFVIVYGTIVLLGRAMRWREAPVQNAVVATLAVTVAYILTDGPA
ncbi:hypothetical protein [Aurantiacibacter hainanensis]|uniref:hypothetical protein n=1 Tax=Aurantiacibacter hainanensis TaxID=3076114 RepID=UPI0030C74627